MFQQIPDATVGPNKGNVVVNPNGTFTYTPNNPTVRGMDKFKFRATDQFGLTSDAIASVFIGGAIRVMPLGDSITQGVFHEGSCAPDGNCPAGNVRVSYRKKLFDDLEAQSPSYAVDMVGGLPNGSAAGLVPPDDRHEGHPGFSSSEVSSNINTWLADNSPDIILLHIGTNSFTTSATDVNNILTNISTWAQSNYPVTVFVARIIQSVDSTLGGSPGAVTTFNDNVEQIATDRPSVKVFKVNQQTGAAISYVIDATPNCLNNGVCENSKDMADNLHPNPSGYAKMAGQWKADLQNATGVLPTCP